MTSDGNDPIQQNSQGASSHGSLLPFPCFSHFSQVWVLSWKGGSGSSQIPTLKNRQCKRPWTSFTPKQHDPSFPSKPKVQATGDRKVEEPQSSQQAVPGEQSGATVITTAGAGRGLPTAPQMRDSGQPQKVWAAGNSPPPDAPEVGPSKTRPYTERKLLGVKLNWNSWIGTIEMKERKDPE